MAELTKEQLAFVSTYLSGAPTHATESTTPGIASGDSPSSDRGKTLTAEEKEELERESKVEAVALIEVAQKAEGKTTDALSDLAKQTGGEMVGLDYRLKSEESLTRKIFDIADQTGEPPEEVAKDMKDVLRYTTVFAPKDYVKGVEDTCRQLLATGHRKKKFKNTWGNKTGYLGINAVFVTPEGAMFELQFHTPDSFYAKDKGTHDLYEEQRRLDPADPRYIELEMLQQDVFNGVERPEGADKLK